MPEHTLEDQARAWIRTHFEEQPGAPGSLMSDLTGKSSTQRQTVGGTVKPGFSPTRVHATESRATGRTKAPVSTGFCTGHVRRAINSLPAVEQNLVHTIYNPGAMAKAAHGAALIMRLWDDFQIEKRTTADTRQIILLLITLQVQKSRNYGGFCAWTAKRPPEITSKLSAQQWSNTYRAHWEQIREHMERIDESAMHNVYAHIR